jgi:prepilin-type N-terminal cleavage/methylation domain-containing protein
VRKFGKVLAGFTAVEVLIVIAILAFLAAIVEPKCAY